MFEMIETIKGWFGSDVPDASGVAENLQEDLNAQQEQQLEKILNNMLMQAYHAGENVGKISGSDGGKGLIFKILALLLPAANTTILVLMAMGKI